MNAFFSKRRFLVPEVVQTSAMDCGPASLKCLLEGFGVRVSYGRLREACQTDVDGTSIDTMEEVAAQLGLDAEQVMVPSDHLLLPESGSLPAIVIVRLANGLTHFVVVWRTHGRFVQVMDPGMGRRWMSREQLIAELYIHAATIPASAWRGWVASDSFLNPLRRRLRELGASKGEIESLIESALGDESWRSMAALDAAARMTAAIVDAGGLSRGSAAARILRQFAERARREIGGEQATIPSNYWSVSPSGPNEEGEEQLKVRGAVLVQAHGRRAKGDEVKQALSPELVAALDEEPARPGLDLIRLLRLDGLLTPLSLIAALAIATCGLMVEALLFQGLFDLSRKLAPTEQRLGAMAALIAFASALLLLEWPLASNALKMGRGLETRLRVAFLEKIPRLGDRYFQSRLISDMAERSHSAHSLRQLPSLGARFLRLCFELALTTAGLIWLDPTRTWAGAWASVVVAVIALALPLAMQSRLTERDLRIRNHNGALSRFYLDAMLGLAPIRAHGAERAVRGEHESLLVEWMRASYDYLRAVVSVETVQSLIGFGLAAWLLFDHLSRAGASGGLLLMVYWALNLPALGQEIAMLAQQYPSQRNVTLRLLEPLGAPEEGQIDRETERQRDRETVGRRDEVIAPLSPSLRPSISPSINPSASNGVALSFENVSVRAGGHLILDHFDLRIEAGSHVAVVGPSGAGKSSFVGLLLGWHRAADGRLTVDGEELTSGRLARLRRETAWVDPAVQLWNRSFIDNLRYGNLDCGSVSRAVANATQCEATLATARGTDPQSAIRSPQSAIEMADLRRVLEKLPEGLQTRLGEAGGLVSGGEGQRVRFGRALMKADARLVILDEPFRGLDREKRRALLEQAREFWRDATLLCVTHDVGETLDFDRVLVMDGGRIVEDAQAVELASRRDSLYRALLDDEEVVRSEMWASDEWRRLRVDGGRVSEEGTAQIVRQAASLSPASTNGHCPKPQQANSEHAGTVLYRFAEAKPMTIAELENLCWPISQLGEAMRAVARHCDLSPRDAEVSNPPAALQINQPTALAALNEWMETAADFLGYEAEAIEAPYAEVEKLARGAGPALLLLPEGGILAVIKSGARHATVIAPDLKSHRAPAPTICSALRRPHEVNVEGEVERLLIEAGTPKRRLARARAAILRERLGQRRVNGGWLLRMPPGASLRRQLGEEGLLWSLASLFGLRLIHYALLMTAWWMLGRGALNGQFDQAWMTAWALLLLTAVPFHLSAEWMQGRFAVEAGARLKRRLLFGALRLQPEEIRHLGAGQMLGKIAESTAIESLALSGGFVALSALIELAMAAVILAVGGGGWSQVVLLLGCVAMTVFVARVYYRRRLDWTETREAMTNDLVERMVGHRTRLAQESREHWHEGEDRAVESYLTKSQAMDRAGVSQTMAPRVWLAAGLCGLAVTFVTGGGATTAMAVSVGGLLLGYRGLQKLATSLSSLLGAVIAWKRIAGIFNAASREQNSGSPDFATARGADSYAQGDVLVEAHDLTFRYREHGEPALRGCGLRIREGDRMLLEGESGGGKSTLASLLTGLRKPESGLLLLGGLDHQTIGAPGWRKRVVSAPQFHENHVLTGTFAFNLLMGRAWPPSEKDIAEAEEVCRALGLGDLLERMPAGLLQMVGETGWQLSHGERSRLFMARAMLQRADLVILDESFGALDPATLRRCLQTALDRARTLMVIAHP